MRFNFNKEKRDIARRRRRIMVGYDGYWEKKQKGPTGFVMGPTGCIKQINSWWIWLQGTGGVVSCLLTHVVQSHY